MTIKYTLGNIVGELPTKEYMREHKFVVIIKGERGAVEFVFHSQVNTGIIHKNILESNLEDKNDCVGGGEIWYCKDYKGTRIGGLSQHYGRVHPEICDAFGKLLSEKYGINYEKLREEPLRAKLSNEWNDKYEDLEELKK